MKEVPQSNHNNNMALYLGSVSIGKLSHQLQNSHSKLWKDIYCTYRDPFIHRAKRNYDCDKETAQDIFQDSLTALYQNLQKPTAQQLNAPLKAYLYKVGDYKIINLLKKKALEKHKLSFFNLPEISIEFELTSELQTHQKRLLEQLLCHLDKRSQSILQLFYFQNYCLEAVARELNYVNTDVAKTKRLQAVRKIQKIIRSKHIKHSIFI